MDFTAYLGLDVHKSTIAVAIADAGRTGDVRFYGEIGNTPEAVAALLKKLANRLCAVTLCLRGWAMWIWALSPDQRSRPRL
jgi:hypothetical protein